MLYLLWKKVLKFSRFFIFILLSLSCSTCGLFNSWDVKSSSDDTLDDITAGNNEEGVVFTDGKTIITQYGISWFIEGDKRGVIGKFVNGDYWIIGPIEVINIDPQPVNGRNGSMINPSVGIGQAYDSRANDYIETSGVSFPRTLKAGDSLVSTRSIPDNAGEIVKDFSDHDVGTRHAKLQSAAVLTCLENNPGDNMFRPTYMGTNKKLYMYKNSKVNILPSLIFDISKIEKYTFDDAYDYYIRGLQRPWIIHPINFTARDVHPVDNMKNYHADLNKFFGEASLLLMINPGELSSKREKLLMYYIQVGIDYYHMCILGVGDFAFNAWPVIFTGLMLAEPDIYNVFVNKKNKYDPTEFFQSYYISETTSLKLSTLVTKGEIWTGYIHPDTGRRPAWRQDVGTNGEYEHLHPSEWDGVGDTPGAAKRESYRRINSPLYPAYALTAWIYYRHFTSVNILALFDHYAFFDYTDRWMSEDMTIPCSTYNTYWSSWAGDIYPKDYQYASTGFVTEMWAEYRNHN